MSRPEGGAHGDTLDPCVRQELMRRPLSRTVQAPHWPRLQPFLAPVKSRRLRRRSSGVARGSVSSSTYLA